MKAIRLRFPLALLACAAVVLAACSTGTAGSVAPPGVPAALPLEVSPVEGARLQAEGALVLDVREPDEWATGHVPGATLIPLGTLSGRFGELPRERELVVICRTGNRSAQARDLLLAAGFPAVTSVAGGIGAWAAAGLAIEPGS